MKKILTLLLAFVAVGAYAQQKVVFLGDCDVFWGASSSDDYSYTDNSLTIKAEAFTDINTGDYLEIIGLPITKLTKKSDSSEADNYTYQIKLCGWDESNSDTWRDISTTLSMTHDPTYYQLTADDVEDIKANGLVIQGYAFTIKRVAVGSQPTFSDSPTNITCASEYSFTLNNDWSSKINITSDMSNYQVGDKITFTYSCGTYSNAWDCQIQLADGSDSENTLYGVSVGGQTSTTFILTEDVVLRMRQNHTLMVKGINVTISNIQHVSRASSLSYKLFGNLADMTNLAYIPSGSNISLYRPLKSGWNTICLPFATTATSIATGAEVYTYTSATKDAVTLTKVDGGAMTAGTPYMLKMSSAQSSPITFSDVTISATTAGATSEINGLTFKGNYSAGMAMADKYGLVNDGSSSSIKKGSGENAKLPAFAAYFDGTKPNSAPSRGFSIEVGDGTTGIDAMERVVEEDNGPTYNLMGQQTTTPRKGIYIKNGKKYIAK